jgi:hypothetical protein
MRSSAKQIFEVWNRKLHFYLGLYFLFFLWLFSFTGLLLNHGGWAISTAANRRTESKYQSVVSSIRGNTDVERAHDVMRQLHLVGELDLPVKSPAGMLVFNVNRPRDASLVQVNLQLQQAIVQHFDNSGWAAFRIFHTFSGSRFNAPESGRDWILTTVWAFAMDALAVGLIVMTLGSYYMWYCLKKKRRLGFAVLAVGFASCALFLTEFLKPR